MLIINADDWGRNRAATDNIILCFKSRRITSASAMLFMEDSQRAAELGLEHGLDAGLHLNFTIKFSKNVKWSKLYESQQRIASFLNISKYCSILYNPLLKKDFHYVFNAQYDEYVRLYKKAPTHIDGHHHMHLCTNMLVDRLIPKGSKVRRNFSFFSGEKTILNRFYRNIIDKILMRRYTCTDYFFSIWPPWQTELMRRIVNLAKSQNVELMMHPERKKEFEYLMSDEYFRIISLVGTGNYGSLQKKSSLMLCHR